MACRPISVAVATVVASFFGLVAAKAPDMSLDTTPVAYYGANWNRSQVNIDQLAKMQMVSESEVAARLVALLLTVRAHL